MMFLTKTIIAATALLCSFGNAVNVLVVNPYLSHSHFDFLMKLTNILADEGHNMTVIINELDTSQVKVKQTKAKVLIRSDVSLSPTSNGKDQFVELPVWNTGYKLLNERYIFTHFQHMMRDQCERFLTDKAFIESIKSQHFDIAMIEPTDFCGYGFLKAVGLKDYVNVIPMALAEQFALAHGLPGRNYEDFPGTLDQHPGLSYFERISNYALPYVRWQLSDFDPYGLAGSVVRKYADPNFDMNDAVAHARFTFLNTEEHTDMPRPISHKIIYIGGVTVANSSANELPDDYTQFMDSAEKGVVLISFGSLAESAAMPLKMKQSFLDMFAAFPDISFIWKYENTSDTVADDLPNVFKRTWVPQPMILAHPKLLAFVTHCGMNSVMEAGHAGIPLLAIPLFYDQSRNAKMFEYRRSAVIVEKNDITSEALIAAMHKLTDDDSYRTRARTIAALARTKPLSGKQRFISYFNHAVQFVHAEDHLDIGHRKLDTFRYYNLDIFATFAVIFAVFIFIFVKTVLIIARRLLCFSQLPLSQKKQN